MGVMPSFLAQAAVSMAWLDWAPPVVNTTWAPWSRASASRNSSLRTLLPPSPTPVMSSRLIHTLVPSSRLMFSSRCTGVGSTAREIRLNSFRSFILSSR